MSRPGASAGGTRSRGGAGLILVQRGSGRALLLRSEAPLGTPRATALP